MPPYIADRHAANTIQSRTGVTDNPARRGTHSSGGSGRADPAAAAAACLAGVTGAPTPGTRQRMPPEIAGGGGLVMTTFPSSRWRPEGIQAETTRLEQHNHRRGREEGYADPTRPHPSPRPPLLDGVLRRTFGGRFSRRPPAPEQRQDRRPFLCFWDADLWSSRPGILKIYNGWNAKTAGVGSRRVHYSRWGLPPLIDPAGPRQRGALASSQQRRETSPTQSALVCTSPSRLGHPPPSMGRCPQVVTREEEYNGLMSGRALGDVAAEQLDARIQAAGAQSCNSIGSLLFHPGKCNYMRYFCPG